MSSAHAQLFGVWASTDHSRFHLFIYLISDSVIRRISSLAVVGYQENHTGAEGPTKEERVRLPGVGRPSPRVGGREEIAETDRCTSQLYEDLYM